MQYVFLELPKYTAGSHPTDLVDKWALFFRDAENLDVIPKELDEEPFREAFEIARIAQLSEAEYDFYEQQKMKEQDARGMLVKAREEGHAEGHAKGHAEGHAKGHAEGHAKGHTEGHAKGHAEGEEDGRRTSIREFCEATGIGWDDERQRHVDTLPLEGLQALWKSLLRDQRWP